MTVTIDQQIASVRREIALRKSAYPRWVANGRMKQDAATAEIEAMQATHDSLMAIKEGRLVPAPEGAVPTSHDAPPASPDQGELI